MDTDDDLTDLPSILEVVRAWADVVRQAGPLVSRIDMRRVQIEALGERVVDLPAFGEAIGGPFMGVPLVVDDELPDDVAYRIHRTDGTLEDVPLPRPDVFLLDRAALELTAGDEPLWAPDVTDEFYDLGRVGPPWRLKISEHPHMPPDEALLVSGDLAALARAWAKKRLEDELKDPRRLVRIVRIVGC